MTNQGPEIKASKNESENGPEDPQDGSLGQHVACRAGDNTTSPEEVTAHVVNEDDLASPEYEALEDPISIEVEEAISREIENRPKYPLPPTPDTPGTSKAFQFPSTHVPTIGPWDDLVSSVMPVLVNYQPIKVTKRTDIIDKPEEVKRFVASTFKTEYIGCPHTGRSSGPTLFLELVVRRATSIMSMSVSERTRRDAATLLEVMSAF